MGRDRPESYHLSRADGKGVAIVSSAQTTAGDQLAGEGQDLRPAVALLARSLRIGGFGAATTLFDELAGRLVEAADRLGAPLLRALTEAREGGDALAAADLLDGLVAPRLTPLGDGADPTAELAPEWLPAGRDAAPRRLSRLDPSAEAELQLQSMGSDAHGPIALLGAGDTPIAERVAALATPSELLLWDPARASDAGVRTVAKRPWRRFEAAPPVSALPHCTVWIHPALGGTDRRQAERVRARLRGATPRMDPPSKERGLRLVVLVRVSPFHLDAPLVATLRSLGISTAVATVHGDARDERLADALVEQRPDLVLSVNGAALTLSANLRAHLDAAEIPVALWFVDDPELALGEALDLARPHVLAFAWEREAVARLRALGFAGSQYLPHGARFGRAQVATPPTPLANAPHLLWIGSSYAGADRQALHAGARADGSGWQQIEARLGADPRLSPAALRRASPAPGGRDGLFLQLRACDRVAAQRRAALARALLPLGLVLFGDVDGWRRQLGSAARVHPDVDAATVVPHLVGAARISVDCVHPQMPTAVTQRVFDVPACGGLVLADDRPDLRACFEVGTEVLAYGSPKEAQDLARWALRHPQERERIAGAARSRVLAEHLLEHRLRRLLAVARHHFGLRVAG